MGSSSNEWNDEQMLALFRLMMEGRPQELVLIYLAINPDYLAGILDGSQEIDGRIAEEMGFRRVEGAKSHYFVPLFSNRSASANS